MHFEISELDDVNIGWKGESRFFLPLNLTPCFHLRTNGFRSSSLENPKVFDLFSVSNRMRRRNYEHADSFFDRVSLGQCNT